MSEFQKSFQSQLNATTKPRPEVQSVTSKPENRSGTRIQKGFTSSSNTSVTSSNQDKETTRRYKKPYKSGGYRYSNNVRLKPDAKIDYKDLDILVNFVNDKGKILPRRFTGLTPLQQRRIAKAIKRARHTGLLPYIYK